MENTSEIIVLSQELKKQVNYSVTEEKLKELEQEALALKVSAVDDLKGYGLCKAKRNEIVKIRTGLDRERVKIKEEAQSFVKYVDSSARLIRTRLEDLESTLKQQELIVENEIARRKEEHDRMLAERRASRVEALRSFRFEVKFEDLETLTNMSDEDFKELSQNAESQFKQELAREQAERDRQEAERKRVAELEAESKRREAELKLANEKIAEMERKANEEARKRAEEVAEQQRKKAQEQERLRLEVEAKARAEQDRLQAELNAKEAEKQRFAEEQRQKQEAEAKAQAEREAELQNQVKDKQRLEEIKICFPTIEEAWFCIFTLLKASPVSIESLKEALKND